MLGRFYVAEQLVSMASKSKEDKAYLNNLMEILEQVYEIMKYNVDINRFFTLQGLCLYLHISGWASKCEWEN